MSATVATFYNVLDAQLLKAFLESRNITCFLADEHIISVQPFYSSAIGGVKVNVHPAQYEQAIRLYDEFQAGVSEENHKLPDCPACGSEQVLLLPVKNTIYYNEFRCFDCDHEWDDRLLHNINPGHIE